MVNLTTLQEDKTGSPRQKRSIEIEYWVINEEGQLTDPGSMVDAAPGVEREFVIPLLEIKTSPCESSAELRKQLYSRLSRVLAAGEKEGTKLVPLSTPLHAKEIEDLPHERTRIQDRVVGDQFECVRHCAGTHIHFEQIPGREVDQLNLLTAIDPALALVNSAPYFQGSYVADSARSEIYRWKAYDNLPYQGQLWPYVKNIEEWATRLDRRYEEFVTDAITKGIDRSEVESCFDPESAVWTPVKLRAEFPTVEWRSPDTAFPDQVLELADQVNTLMQHLRRTEIQIEGDRGSISGDKITIPTFDVVENHVRLAIQRGLQSPEVRSYLDQMGFDILSFDPITYNLHTEETISIDRARTLRLKYAEQLEKNVINNQPINIHSK